MASNSDDRVLEALRRRPDLLRKIARQLETEPEEHYLGLGREIGSMSVNHLGNRGLIVLETEQVEVLGHVFALLRNVNVRLLHLGTGTSQDPNTYRFFLLLDLGRRNGTFEELIAKICGIDGLRVLFREGPAQIVSDPFSRISLMGAEVVILPRETFNGIIDSIVNILGIPSIPVLFKAWEKAGRIDAHWYRDRSGLTGLSLLEAYMTAWQGTGWGRAEVHAFNENQVSGTIRIYDSFEVWLERKSAECILTRGILNGALCEIFGTYLQTTEISCAARKSPYCEFQFKKRESVRLGETAGKVGTVKT